jgi:acyl-[acyl-carrier-protein]-phospholipid O-acyltransferase/long-chain-fatty-acid--[acyl-carrier-protein] ligase
MVVVLLAFDGLEEQLLSGSEAARQAAYQQIGTTAMLVFVLPLILFSLPAGVIADRVSKRSIILSMKVVEVCLMTAALFTLALAPGVVWPALVIVGLMGVQSAIFGPAKYGILPEILPHERLSEGNGLVQLWTFLAIVLGTGAAGPLVGLTGDRVWIIGVVLVAFSLVGTAAALLVPRVSASRSAGGLVETVSTAARIIRHDRVLLFSVIGLVLFWMVGSLVLQNVLVYGRSILGLGQVMATVPSAILSVGIGMGSVLAVRLSASKVEYGLIPLGALGLGLFIAMMGTLHPNLVGTVALMTLGGVAGGLVIVPLEALLQWQSPADRRGGIIALSNVFISSGTLLGSTLVFVLAKAMSPDAVFLVGGLIALAGTAWALWLLPAAFIRLVAIILTHTLYRITVVDGDNVPSEGEALLIPNHVSLIDAFFILASTDRQVRFLVSERTYALPVLNPFFRMMRAIPIGTSGGPKVVVRAMREAAAHLDTGEVVCIFPEGEITRTGMLLPFRQGFERMVKGRTTPIIPVHLDQVWGSIFSREGGRFVWKVPKRIPYPLTVSFGTPMAADTPTFEVRQAVRELGAQAWNERKVSRPLLHRSFIRSSRRRPRALAFADATRPKLSRFGALVGSIAMARRLRTEWQGDEAVGILLPPSVAAVLVNLAATLSGRTVVNLNYTAGPAGLESAVRQSGIRTVVTSELFLEKAEITLPDGIEPIWISQVATSISGAARAIALLIAVLVPAPLIERFCGATKRMSVDDTVAIIFSSGSTGEPKGVCLSHFNLDANVEASAQVFHLLPNDRILGVLPLFHSFGYMTTFWFAANHGLGVVFHPNPLDAPAHADLIRKYKITMLASTPTFLQIYTKRASPGDLGSLRVALVGAEKLSDRVADAFQDRFGIRPLEGYGATECSPIIAVSVPDHRMPGFYQTGSRDGFLGRAMPGVALRVVDPEGPEDTLEALPPETAGMLLVRGSNVMQGYLGRDDLTSKALRDGWYVTGDIALIDVDGFVRITDRLSRFSKIGGEMVPHGRVEEALHQVTGIEHQVFAVTAVPDEKKGEKLAVLHTIDPEGIPGLLDEVKQSGLPNLFIPRADAFVQVDALPMLGTGKIDLQALKRIANEALGT